jgi:hypothetical protein
VESSGRERLMMDGKASKAVRSEIHSPEACGQVLEAHACNPSYSGGRDQENCGSKPAWANSSMRTYLKKPFTKMGLVEWLKMKALSSSPSTSNKKK